MTKQAGLGDNYYVGGYDLSGDTNSISRLSTSRGVLPVTGIDKSAIERLHAHRDGGIDWVSYFNDAALAAHPALKTLPHADVVATYCRGTTRGNPALACVAKQIGYDPNRSEDGHLKFGVNVAANSYGSEWGVQLTAGKQTDGAAGNGTSVDLGSASPGAFGLQMFVHLFAFTGTSVTIKLQESSDNGAGDAFADVVGATTAALTAAPTAVRIQTGLINVERYLRVVTVGAFSNAVFAVMAHRNENEIEATF
jgi:hypothetical protein